MKLSLALLVALSGGSSVDAFTASSSFIPRSFTTTNSASSSQLSMVLEKPKKLAKIEILKSESDHLKIPLLEVSYLNFENLCLIEDFAIVDMFRIMFILL